MSFPTLTMIPFDYSVRSPGICWLLDIVNGQMRPCLYTWEQCGKYQGMSPAIHNFLRSAAEWPESLETALYQVIKESTGNRVYLSLKISFSFAPQVYFPRVCNSRVLILYTWLSFTETVTKNMRLTISFWMWESATNYFLKVIWATLSSW